MKNDWLNQRRTTLIGFGLVLLLAWSCYRPALTGAMQLDDVSNLGGLAQVSDFDSALNFTLSGGAGPLGRPISLATFAVQADSWEQGAAAFLTFNFALHLLNAVLLAFCVYRLSLVMAVQRDKAMTVAMATASVWVLMPLLATSSMLVVQRMTTLSAAFVLLGLAGYLVARKDIDNMPRRALVGMSGSLVGGTILAMFCKESGLLLPVFVLVIESTVLERPNSIDVRQWRLWKGIFLVLPLLLIVAYLATRLGYPDWVVQRRGFTAGERVMTEARILWLYLLKALFGLPDKLGIFQDAPTVSRSVFEPLTLLASLSWVLLAGAAVVWRRRYPIAALAVLWYLAGHLIESTVVMLELYFEHRNYLPIIGPIAALCSLVLVAGKRWRVIGVATLATLVLFNTYFLYVFASLWGEPSLASRHWAMTYPHSVRAVGTLASYQLDEEGPLRTLQTIDRFVIGHPQHAYLRIQELNLLCRYARDASHAQVVEQLERELPNVDFTYTAGKMLSQLFDGIVVTECPDVNLDTVVALARTLRSNPRYAADPSYSLFHYKLLAGIARYQGDHTATVDNLRKALTYGPSGELNMMMVTALAGDGNFDAAHDFIDDAKNNAPTNPLRAIKWRRDLDGLRAYIDELEKLQQ
jgi:hypothetical protein